MAGDWIKMRTDLYRDPKVCLMADMLLEKDSVLSRYVNQNMACDMVVTRNVMRNVTVGALVSVWGVLRHRGKRIDDDLVIKGCTVSVIDDVADLPGFGFAMESVGWAIEDDGNLVLPRFFDEFNVDPADESRAKNAERQRRYRDKIKEKSNVTVTSQSNSREEKRREENIPSLVPGEAGRPDCPHEAILTLYHEHLPVLPAVKVWSEKRKKLLQARWREDPKRQSLGYWERFFKYVAASDFLTGRAGSWQADLEWLLNSSNFVKVIEGKYENRETK